MDYPLAKIRHVVILRTPGNGLLGIRVPVVSSWWLDDEGTRPVSTASTLRYYYSLSIVWGKTGHNCIVVYLRISGRLAIPDIRLRMGTVWRSRSHCCGCKPSHDTC